GPARRGVEHLLGATAPGHRVELHRTKPVPLPAKRSGVLAVRDESGDATADGIRRPAAAADQAAVENFWPALRANAQVEAGLKVRADEDVESGDLHCRGSVRIQPDIKRRRGRERVLSEAPPRPRSQTA